MWKPKEHARFQHMMSDIIMKAYFAARRERPELSRPEAEEEATAYVKELLKEALG